MQRARSGAFALFMMRHSTLSVHIVHCICPWQLQVRAVCMLHCRPLACVPWHGKVVGMTASALARSAPKRGALLAAGLRGRAAARHRALPEGTHVLSAEAAADQQSDSSWSFPVRPYATIC